MDLAHRRLTPDFTLICFWRRHELRQLWYMRVPPWVVCVFSLGYSSAPEWLEPVLWPRAYLLVPPWVVCVFPWGIPQLQSDWSLSCDHRQIKNKWKLRNTPGKNTNNPRWYTHIYITADAIHVFTRNIVSREGYGWVRYQGIVFKISSIDYYRLLRIFILPVRFVVETVGGPWSHFSLRKQSVLTVELRRRSVWQHGLIQQVVDRGRDRTGG